jgi:uncharacterized protein (DUF2336 family)
MDMTPTARSLLAELDATLAQAPETWRRDALRRIVDLFLSGAESYSGDHVAVFDDVMLKLIRNMDRAQLVELSNKLAPVDNAPAKVIGNLARHSDSTISGPILTQAKGLPDRDLAEIIDKDRTDPNLFGKIAARPNLGEPITDVLLKRGNAAIQRKIIDNPNARVSEAGFARLIMGLNGDKDLAQAIAARKDVPAELRLWLTATLSK